MAIRCTNEVLQAGDEIPIEFIITNQGTNDYKYENRNYDRSGRMWEFKLTARTEAGVEVAGPRSKGGGGMMGGLFGYAVLKPGQSLERVIPLNLWALVTEPGRYGVTGVYGADNPEATALTSTPITVTVRPRTAAEMDDYIGGLTNALAARLRGGSSPDGNSRWAALGTEELVRKLMYTGSSNMVPALLPLTGAPGNGGFLLNGGRLYIDMGHLEYSSPECRMVEDSVAYDLAGDQLLQSALEALGVHAIDACVSPLRGPAGNVEFFYRIARAGAPLDDARIDALVAQAHAP